MGNTFRRSVLRSGLSIRESSSRWECGNRIGDFQGRWEGWKSCFWISRLSTVRHFPGLPGSLEPQPAQQREVQGALKGMLPRVQKSQPHRTVQHFEIALVERPQTQPLVGENLADEGAHAAHFQAALLRHATQFD